MNNSLDSVVLQCRFAYRSTKTGHNFSKLSDLADLLGVCSTLRARQNRSTTKSQLLLLAGHEVLKVGRFGGYPGRTNFGHFHVFRPTDLNFQHFSTIKKVKCSSNSCGNASFTHIALPWVLAEVKPSRGSQPVNFEIE